MNEWKPIETAPLDGKIIDLWVNYGGGVFERAPDCFWRLDCDDAQDSHWRQIYAESGESSFALLATPTHWMERPEGPS